MLEKHTNGIKNIAAALIEFHSKVGNIKKNSKNPFYGSKYASLSIVLEAIKQPLMDAGLSFAQFPTGENGLTTILMHKDSGEFLESTYTMRPVKNDPQGVGSAITYMRRYALGAILGLNVDDDDDGNAATHEPQGKKKSVAKPTISSLGPQQAPPHPDADKVNGTTQEKPYLDKNSKKYDLVAERLKNKTTTLAQTKQYFRLTPEIEKELQSIVNEAAAN